MIRENVEAFGDFSPIASINVTATVQTNCAGTNPFDENDDTDAIQAALGQGRVKERQQHHSRDEQPRGHGCVRHQRHDGRERHDHRAHPQQKSGLRDNHVGKNPNPNDE